MRFIGKKTISKCLFHGEANNMISVKDLIKEYHSRRCLCSHCEYNNIKSCRCYKCKNGNIFVDTISLKEYVGDRIAEETAKEFLQSECGIMLKTIMEVRERNYRNFVDHVNSQKEKLDSSLEIYREAYNAAKSDFDNAMKSCMAIQVYKALEELDGEQA